MILAATECPDATITLERPEWCTALHRTQIAREIVSVCDRAMVLVVRAQRVQVCNCEKRRDDERTGTAQARRRRKVARERDIGPTKRTRTVASDATSDGDRLIRPRAVRRKRRATRPRSVSTRSPVARAAHTVRRGRPTPQRRGSRPLRSGCRRARCSAEKEEGRCAHRTESRNSSTLRVSVPH